MTYPGFPNYFMLYGPGSNLGHSSILYVLECQANYILDCIRTVVGKDKRSMELKYKSLNPYLEWCDAKMPQVVFGAPNCTSWYKNKKGINWTNWPADLVTFWWNTLSCNDNDYLME